MTPQQKIDYIAALRSGRYKQARGALYRASADPGEPGSYCCLGVACVVLGFEIQGTGVVGGGSMKRRSAYVALEPYIPWWDRASMIRMNDDRHNTFDEIADWAEKNL